MCRNDLDDQKSLACMFATRTHACDSHRLAHNLEIVGRLRGSKTSINSGFEAEKHQTPWALASLTSFELCGLVREK